MSELPPSRLSNATLEWDASNRPRSTLYGDIYYSSADALGESSHVFLEGNQLEERFRILDCAVFTIGELGFGAGLNFLNACRLWQRCAPAGATLHYFACEMHPLAVSDMRRLHTLWPELAAFSEKLLQCYPDHTAGVHQMNLHFDRHRVCLTLLYGEAQDLLRCVSRPETPFVDAWFLDGFSPRLNPALWQDSLLQLLAAMGKPGCTLSSYSVAGHFRKGLQAAGFSVDKRPGYARKRHMLHARLPTGQTSGDSIGSNEGSTRYKGSVCVIGGGLAGCSTARALAENGWQVTLLERSNALASQGSGNPQAILHCKPGRMNTPVNHFDLHAYLHAARYYGELAITEQLQWHQCGMLQVGVTDALRKRHRQVADSGLYAGEILKYLEAECASALAGVQLQDPALYFPASGWLSPPALCALYVQHPDVLVRVNAEVLALRQAGQRWRVTTRDDADNAELDVDRVVLCNSADVHSFCQTRHYPLSSNRGQVDVYTANADSAPQLVICGQGYILPGAEGLQSTGGSYFIGDQAENALQQRRAWHLLQLRQISEKLDTQLSAREPVQQRIGTRAVLPDRMPLVGAVSKPLSEGGESYTGLFVNTGHGSHGLSRTPLCAAWLASLFDGTVPPLPHELAALIAPQRYKG